jgi:isovaleryl-CoA dehydrogenase
MIRFNLLRRFTPRNGKNLKPRLQRFASSYDADIAGLTEDEAEVTLLLLSGIFTKLVNQFRDAVTQFAEKEISPRAAEIDKSNNFPSVR